jgi:hypothetical protein
VLRLVQTTGKRAPTKDVLHSRILEIAGRSMPPEQAERLLREATEGVPVERKTLRRRHADRRAG